MRIICEARDLAVSDGHTLSFYQFQNVIMQVSCQLHSRKLSCNNERNLFCP